MPMIIENLNKGFEEKYGLKETHSKSTLLEKTTPEDRDKSEKVETIAKRLYWGEPISSEDKKFLDTLDLEIRKGSYIVPKSTPKGEEPKYDVTFKAGRGLPGDKKDYSQLAQKRLARSQQNPGWEGEGQSSSRSSEEEKKLQRKLKDAQSYGTERSVKNLSTRLQKEQNRLAQQRKKLSFQQYEREEDEKRMEQPVRDFRRSKYYLSHHYPEKKAYQDERTQRARSRYEDELAEIEKDTQKVEQERKFHQDRVDTLLKRKKEESLIRRRPRRK